MLAALPPDLGRIGWVDRISFVTEDEGPHPDRDVWWCKIPVVPETHTATGLSINDLIVAAKLAEAWGGVRRAERGRHSLVDVAFVS